MKKTIFVALILPCFLVLCGLGFWQIERLKLKKVKIASLEKHMNSSHEDIAKIDLNDKDQQFKPLFFTGNFDNPKKALLFAVNPKNSTETGFFLLDVASVNGKNILVSRGFVKKMPNENEMINQNIKIFGILKDFEKPNFFTPANNLQENMWFHINKNELEKFTNAKLENFYVISQKEVQNEMEITSNFPIKQKSRIEIRNDHLSYAITWFSLAFFLLLMTYLRFFKKNSSKHI